MSNALYQQLNQNNIQPNSQINEFIGFLNQVNQFKSKMQGMDPKAEVMRLLQSGMTNQQEINQFQQIAQQFNSMF